MGKRDRTRIKIFRDDPAEQVLSIAGGEKGEIAALHFPDYPYPHCVKAAVGALFYFIFFFLFSTMI